MSNLVAARNESNPGSTVAGAEGLASGSSSHAPFVRRHIGPGLAEAKEMLDVLGCSSLEDLVGRAVPSKIRLADPLRLPEGRSEDQVLAALRLIAGRNRVFRSYIGMGYYGCVTPGVIQRNVLENPRWYTPYTPYQAEISQGRLEALLNFQTLVTDLTGFEIANASLLDEATAAAEAMIMCHNLREGRNAFFVAETCHPQNIEVVRTRATALGFRVVVGDPHTSEFDENMFGVLVQYPDTYGSIHDLAPLAERVHKAGGLLVVATDLLALTLIRPPGEFGADVAVGNSQRFGVPLNYGGPHAAFFATRDLFKRQMPGRIVGVSKDSRGRQALRLALQTREQHIRREKATSNICTAQSLLANAASFYACYHGPEGLKAIAMRVHKLTCSLAANLEDLGYRVAQQQNCGFFDTLRVDLGDRPVADMLKRAEARQMNFRKIDDSTLGISLDETVVESDVAEICQVFGVDQPANSPQETRNPKFKPQNTKHGTQDTKQASRIAQHVSRTSPFLTQPVFNRYHSETELMRYIDRLGSRDLSLTTSMIPLGSCTMKLNAAAEMYPVTWREFAGLHPFVPGDQARGYQELFEQLESWLAEITGFAAVSLQPNAGSQGEYAGLLTIRAWHEHLGQGRRRICLIPASAHGTNPASAVMAGFKVVPVACDPEGNIDLADLRSKAGEHRDDLAALMVTYPSTHGVFEEGIVEICRIVHEHGGQVYMDGANMNAQVGVCRPGDMGADVCHLNLHKTFCIPHGGGGPGAGPIAVSEHLAPFLPGHVDLKLQISNIKSKGGAVSGAPWGSADILPISWVYIALMGGSGLAQASACAILNANYIARRLDKYFPVLYKGRDGFVAHECILDLRRFRSVTVEDVAKRLMDYGFHAPTISWPVPGTMMVEPTESESKEELDRFCDALIRIHAEMQEVEAGRVDSKDNLLKNAPHTADMVASDNWSRPYTREQAAFPAPWLKQHKFWPAVGRIDNVYGDRNPVCTCAGMEDYGS